MTENRKTYEQYKDLFVEELPNGDLRAHEEFIEETRDDHPDYKIYSKVNGYYMLKKVSE